MDVSIISSVYLIHTTIYLTVATRLQLIHYWGTIHDANLNRSVAQPLKYKTCDCYHTQTDRLHTQKLLKAKFANQEWTQACIFSYGQLTHKMLIFNHEGNSSIMYLNLAENYMGKEMKVWLSNVFIEKKKGFHHQLGCS